MGSGEGERWEVVSGVGEARRGNCIKEPWRLSHGVQKQVAAQTMLHQHNTTGTHNM